MADPVMVLRRNRWLNESCCAARAGSRVAYPRVLEQPDDLARVIIMRLEQLRNRESFRWHVSLT